MILNVGTMEVLHLARCWSWVADRHPLLQAEYYCAGVSQVSGNKGDSSMYPTVRQSCGMAAGKGEFLGKENLELGG